MVLRTLGTLAYPKGYILPANPLSPRFLSPTRRIDVVVDVSEVFLLKQAFLSNALEIQAWHASVGAARSWVASACTREPSPLHT